MPIMALQRELFIIIWQEILEVRTHKNNLELPKIVAGRET